MRFTAVIATSAAVSGALAGLYYEEPVHTTVDDKVYTSVKTCTDKTYEPTAAPVYEPTEAPVYEPAPTDYPVSEVTYTSYEKITVTSCGDYVTNCPAETYTSTAYSVSTCGYPVPTDYYVPPANTTEYYVPPAEYPTESSPVEYPTETAYPTETLTYYTTVCPGKDYCYATTVTSTYCPGKPTETAYVPEKPTYVVPEHETTSTYCPETTTYAHEVPTYVPETPTYVPVPPKNETSYVPPPSYTGAASANAVSFGVAAIAGVAALFIAA